MSLFWNRLIRTDANFAGLAARLTLGLSMLPAGWGKLTSFKETMDVFTKGLGIPAPFAFLVILAESFGAVGLILPVYGVP